MSPTFDVESFATKFWKCQDCGEIFKKEDLGPKLYECNNCGAKFNMDNSNNGRNQCPECMKMAGKIAEQSCPDCEGGEVEEVEGYKCTECDFMTEDPVEMDEHYNSEHPEEEEEEYDEDLRPAEEN